jgi:(1->4)-alpha-D-glucan 1-alpha-D-glucosylmutase
MALQTGGAFSDSCVAFARQADGKSIVVIVPRLSSRVEFPPTGEKWQDTFVELPRSISSARELFTGRELLQTGGRLAVAEALQVLPFAVYISF